MDCPICPILKENIKKYLTDTKYFFDKKFITENYYKHFGISLLLGFPIMWVLSLFSVLMGTGLFFHLCIGGFGAYAVNYLKEWYCGKYLKAPWDITDLNFGSYGGIIAGLLTYILTV